MSEPNQPYGAVPPPSFPPPPGAPGPAGPPPGQPYGGFPPPGGPGGFPPPGAPGGAGSGGGKGKGLWIALGILGVLALVGVVVGLVLVLTGDDKDDKDDKDGDDDRTSATGAAPDEVVEGLIAAAEDADCDKAKTFLTDTAQAADPCSAAEFRLLSSDDVDAEVGDPAIDGDEATVPVSFDNQGNVEDYVFNLEQVDGAWLVASYAVDHSGATDDPTDAPTDPGGSPSGGPSGSSTADAVANDPKSVVEAFLASVVSGDCATAEDLVTEEYLAKEGDCDSSDIPSDFEDQIEYTVGTASVDDAAGTATVPVEVSFAGDKESSEVKLVKVSGQWRVSEFE